MSSVAIIGSTGAPKSAFVAVGVKPLSGKPKVQIFLVKPDVLKPKSGKKSNVTTANATGKKEKLCSSSNF